MIKRVPRSEYVHGDCSMAPHPSITTIKDRTVVACSKGFFCGYRGPEVHVSSSNRSHQIAAEGKGDAFVFASVRGSAAKPNPITLRFLPS